MAQPYCLRSVKVSSAFFMYIMVIRVKSHVFIVSSDKDCLAQQGGVNSRDVERKEGIINLSLTNRSFTKFGSRGIRFFARGCQVSLLVQRAEHPSFQTSVGVVVRENPGCSRLHLVSSLY